MKKLITMMLALVLVMSCGLSYADGTLDVNADVTLTLECMDEGTALSGVEFRLYRAADTDSYGNMSWTGAFAGANIALPANDQDAWRDIETTLASYVGMNGIQPNDEGSTDANGILTFPTAGKTMKPGLYLLLSDNALVNGYIYTFAPQLVFLPDLVETDTPGHYTWEYDVTRRITKYEKVPDIPPDPETVKVRVLKIWNDDDDPNRPEEITVSLLKNGTVYDTVKLTAADAWAYTWEGLDADPMISWSVGEAQLDGYEQLVVFVGRYNDTYVFTITNTLIPPETPTPAPPTPTPKPDETPAPTPEPPTNPPTPTPAPTPPPTGQLRWPIPVLSISGMALVAFGLVRRKRNEEA